MARLKSKFSGLAALGWFDQLAEHHFRTGQHKPLPRMLHPIGGFLAALMAYAIASGDVEVDGNVMTLLRAFGHALWMCGHVMGLALYALPLVVLIRVIGLWPVKQIHKMNSAVKRYALHTLGVIASLVAFLLAVAPLKLWPIDALLRANSYTSVLTVDEPNRTWWLFGMVVSWRLVGILGVLIELRGSTQYVRKPQLNEPSPETSWKDSSPVKLVIAIRDFLARRRQKKRERIAAMPTPRVEPEPVASSASATATVPVQPVRAVPAQGSRPPSVPPPPPRPPLTHSLAGGGAGALGASDDDTLAALQGLGLDEDDEPPTVVTQPHQGGGPNEEPTRAVPGLGFGSVLGDRNDPPGP